MSKNRITAIYFDPGSFPMPPAYTAYTAIENETDITFIGMEKDVYADDSMTVFDDDEIGHAPSLPAGNYYIHARGMEGDDRYKREFFIIEEESGKTAAKFILDNKKHVMSFGDAFERAVAQGDVDYSRFEIEFSKKYLGGVFAGVIEGNDAFWNRFHEDLDVATTPDNLNMLREAKGEPALPVIFRSPFDKPVLN